MSSRTPEVSRSCLSCRLLSGGALLFSSGFVYRSARKAVSRGTRVPVGTGLQLVFAAGDPLFWFGSVGDCGYCRSQNYSEINRMMKMRRRIRFVQILCDET